MCNSKTKRTQKHKERERDRDRIYANPNPRTLSSKKKLSNLKEGEEASSYRGFNLVKLPRQANKVEIPPYTCMEGSKVGYQLSQLAQKYLQKHVNSGRPAKNAI